MKKSLQIFALLFCIITNAQAPEKFSYQALIRNASNALVTNSAVGMKISILKTSSSGTVVYTESQTPTTNANGLVSIQIGGGFPITGDIADINWATDSYFIKTETDPAGGSNYTIAGTTQLLSVPYALYAKKSEVANGLTLPYSGYSDKEGVLPFVIQNTNATFPASYFANTNTANKAPAVRGINNSTGSFGVGIQGEANSNTNGNVSVGVSGFINGTGTSGAGVSGSASNAWGVYGSTNNGTGIKGLSNATGTAGSFQADGTGKALFTYGPLKLNNIGEGAGKVLTSDASGNATWQSPASASSLALPYLGTSAADNVIQFRVKNTSTTQNKAGLFENTDLANEGAALSGENNSINGFGVGVQGIARSNTNGALSSGVKGYVTGNGTSGAGVYGMATDAFGVYGSSDNGTGIKGISFVTGTAGSFQAAGTGTALDVSGPVRLRNIGEAAGKVLTSDGGGFSTWQDLITPNVHFSSVTGTSQAIPIGTIPTYINSWGGLEEAGGANYNASTGEYTIPITGYYYIMSQISFTSLNTAAGGQASVAIAADGFTIKQGFANQAVVGQYYSDAYVHIEKKFTAGQKIKIAVNQYGSPTNNLYAQASNFIINLIHK